MQARPQGRALAATCSIATRANGQANQHSWIITSGDIGAGWIQTMVMDDNTTPTHQALRQGRGQGAGGQPQAVQAHHPAHEGQSRRGTAARCSTACSASSWARASPRAPDRRRRTPRARPQSAIPPAATVRLRVRQQLLRLPRDHAAHGQRVRAHRAHQAPRQGRGQGTPWRAAASSSSSPPRARRPNTAQNGCSLLKRPD